MKRKDTLCAILALSVSVLFCSCSTTEGKKVEVPSSIDLRKGSSTADLIEIWGQPESVEPLEQAPEIDVWTYKKERSVTNLIGADTVEIPYVHPITGEEMTLNEPVFQPQTTTQVQIVRVFIVNETILGWRVENEVEQRTVH